MMAWPANLPLADRTCKPIAGNPAARLAPVTVGIGGYTVGGDPSAGSA
jgi:hypothetical protein